MQPGLPLMRDHTHMCRYREASLTRTLAQAAGFTWCPLGCGTGSVHAAPTPTADDGLAIAYCAACDRQYCRRHGVAWHAEYTCAEYDEMLLQQGDGFRSAAQRARDVEGARRRALDARLDEAETAFAALVRDAVREGDERRRREEEERRRREEEEKEQRRREEKRRLEARKRAEEHATRAALAAGGGLGAVVKSCPGPGCTASIERKAGW